VADAGMSTAAGVLYSRISPPGLAVASA